MNEKELQLEITGTTRGSKDVSSENDYLNSLVRQLWDFAEAELPQRADLLDVEKPDAQRPPVFRKDKAALNLLTPPDADDDLLAAIQATLPIRERHRWFRSMKSSQAVAQSVFGNLLVGRNLGLLEGLESDQGLPAFCEGLNSANAQLEYSVNHLGEPRPTSVDFWVDGSRRIAVECKLTEADFGTCSRPRLTEGRDKNYACDHCDGSYTRQRGRRSRCSLTDIGVKYWEYAPSLFDWNGDDDMRPCPMSATYQLVRNVLASCVSLDGQIDTENAHTLIVYDARNPSFQNGGEANNQWKLARAALRNPELLRSVSWQSLVEHLVRSGEVKWLVDQLKKKYGF